MTRRNEAATEFWEQLFVTMAKAEDAALVDPEHDETGDEARLREGLAQAGWAVTGNSTAGRTASDPSDWRADHEPWMRLATLRRNDRAGPVHCAGHRAHGRRRLASEPVPERRNS